MNRGGNSCYDEQSSQRDHDTVGEVVDGKEESEASDCDQQACLKERVCHVKHHVAPEHNLDDGPADVIHRLCVQGLQLDLVLYELAAACDDT